MRVLPGSKCVETGVVATLGSTSSDRGQGRCPDPSVHRAASPKDRERAPQISAVPVIDAVLKDLRVCQTWIPAHPPVVTSLGPHPLLNLSFPVCEMGTLALNLDIVPGQEARLCLSQAWGGEGGLLGLGGGQQPEPTPCLCEGLRAYGQVGPGLTPVQFLVLV